MAGPSHLALVRAGRGLVPAWLPTPPVGPGDVLVRVERVGVCGTDLQILNGSRPDAARVLGHEGGGWVERVGPGGGPFPVGSRVVVNPVNPRRPAEVLGHSYDGLFQARVLVPAAVAADVLVPVPDHVPADLLPLVEPLGTAVCDRQLVSAACRPERVAVVGGGPVGLLYALLAKVTGAAEVVLLHRCARRVAWAVAAGFADRGVVVPPGTAAPPAGLEVDAAYLCTTRAGAAEGLRLAAAVVRDGGCVDLVSGFYAGSGLPQWQGVEPNDIRGRNVCGATRGEAYESVEVGAGQRVLLTGHRGTSAGHLREAMRYLSAEPERFARLITHVVPLEAGADLVAAMSRGEPPADGRERAKVVLTVGPDDVRP